MKKVTRNNYQSDQFYPRIVNAVNAVLEKSDVVAPVDVFIGMDLLSAQSLGEWKLGKIDFLERDVRCNLAKAERILRVLKYRAEARGMKPSFMAYRRWGKGPKLTLRFSKTGNANCELQYATHYIRNKPKLVLESLTEQISARPSPMEAESSGSV